MPNFIFCAVLCVLCHERYFKFDYPNIIKIYLETIDGSGDLSEYENAIKFIFSKLIVKQLYWMRKICQNKDFFNPLDFLMFDSECQKKAYSSIFDVVIVKVPMKPYCRFF